MFHVEHKKNKMKKDYQIVLLFIVFVVLLYFIFREKSSDKATATTTQPTPTKAAAKEKDVLDVDKWLKRGDNQGSEENKKLQSKLNADIDLYNQRLDKDNNYAKARIKKLKVDGDFGSATETALYQIKGYKEISLRGYDGGYNPAATPKDTKIDWTTYLGF